MSENAASSAIEGRDMWEEGLSIPTIAGQSGELRLRVILPAQPVKTATLLEGFEPSCWEHRISRSRWSDDLLGVNKKRTSNCAANQGKNETNGRAYFHRQSTGASSQISTGQAQDWCFITPTSRKSLLPFPSWDSAAALTNGGSFGRLGWRAG